MLRIIGKFARILLVAIIIIAFSCEKEPIIRPSAAILLTKVYKTKHDYFDFVNTFGGYISAPSTWRIDDTLKFKITEDDTIYLFRWRLINGYVMDIVVTEKDYFTDMTYAELTTLNSECNGCISVEDIFQRVVDKDPFIEYYEDSDTLFINRDKKDIERLNTIISNGELEKYLYKIK